MTVVTACSYIRLWISANGPIVGAPRRPARPRSAAEDQSRWRWRHDPLMSQSVPSCTVTVPAPSASEDGTASTRPWSRSCGGCARLTGSSYAPATHSVAKAGDWHDRSRPGVVARLAVIVRDCDLSRHIDGGDRIQDSPVVGP